MGFPNVDKILVKLFQEQFDLLKVEPEFVIEDLFEDLDDDERGEIASYLAHKNISTDMRSRVDNSLFIHTSFPLISLPLPQISVTLGQEDTDRYMADQTGASEPVTDNEGNVVAWDIVKGCYAKSNWNISVVTTAKDEAIWLSRLCQRMILENADLLDKFGIAEISLSAADMRPEQDMQPADVISRGIRMSATTMCSWTRRIPVGTYQTGNNNGLI